MKIRDKLLIALALGTTLLAFSEKLEDWSTVERSISSRNFECLVGLGTNGSKVTIETRDQCLREADLLDEPPLLTPTDIARGPILKNRPNFGPTDRVYCRLIPRLKNQTSYKFRCHHTDENNILIDRQGNLVSEAATCDPNDRMLDSSGNPITRDGKKAKCDELRIKYFLGQYPEPRIREMFTETLSSRILWVLGVPSDASYLPASVTCFGCSSHPFIQNQNAPTPGAVSTFKLASVKRKYPGEGIRITRGIHLGRARLQGGAGPDPVWDFSELRRHYTKWNSQQKIDFNAVSLAWALIGYEEGGMHQNKLACRDQSVDEATGRCHSVAPYIDDLGSTFRGDKPGALRGMLSLEHQARGDLRAWMQRPLFTNPSTCTLAVNFDGPVNVTEQGRRAMAERLRALSNETIMAIVQASQLHAMDLDLNNAVARETGYSGTRLHEHINELWFNAIKNRRDQILSITCPQ